MADTAQGFGVAVQSSPPIKYKSDMGKDVFEPTLTLKR